MSDRQSPPPKKKKRSGSAKRQREKVISVRVYDTEHAQIEANAAAVDLCASAFLRMLGTGRRRRQEQRRPLSPDMQRVAQLRGQAGRIGGNMYQLVRGMNLGDIPRVEDMYAAAQEARAFIAEVREALGL